MPGYTTAAKVAAHYPSFRLDAAGSTPTSSYIDIWIANSAAIIRGLCLGRGYDLTALTSEQSETLSAINEAGACVDLGDALMSRLSTSDMGVARSQKNTFQRLIEMLDKGSYDKLFLPETASVKETAAKFQSSVPDRTMSTRREKF